MGNAAGGPLLNRNVRKTGVVRLRRANPMVGMSMATRAVTINFHVFSFRYWMNFAALDCWTAMSRSAISFDA